MNKCIGYCHTDECKEKFDIRYTHRNSFQLGYYSCRQCEVYYKGLTKCQCCGGRLSIKPRNATSKRLLNEKLGVKRY